MPIFRIPSDEPVENLPMRVLSDREGKKLIFTGPTSERCWPLRQARTVPWNFLMPR